MIISPLSPGTRRRLLQGQAGPLPAPPSSSVAIFISSTVSDMDAEREALQSSAYPEVQTFCQKHGLMFEALIGDQYGPCPIPALIDEKEWEALRAQLTARPRDLELVARHFRKDENAVPPTYLLQSLGIREARGPEEATLNSALLIEWEIERGLLSSTDRDQGVTVFLREIQDLNKHILEDCALKMVDRLADGCLDMDAQNLLCSLKGRITDMQPGVLKAHHLAWSRDLVNPKNKAHARYLKELGEQFVARANHQVLECLRELEAGRQELAWLYQEIRHHLGLSAEATRTFCGRQELLAQLGQWLRESNSHPHPPLVIFGPPGIGKTALMCKLAEQMPVLLGRKTVTMLRLLGTSQMSSNARGLLQSICFQVCLAYGLPLPPAQVLEAHTRVVQFFHTLLHTVSCRNFESLVILLDSVDEVDSVHRARRVPWLPPKCPPRVHLILSACSGQRGVLDTMRQVLTDPGAYWEVRPLSGNQGQEMIQLLLAASRRTLSPMQRDLLWASLPECGHPGRLRLAFEEARKWASFTVPAPLASTAKEAMHQLCARLEQTHGQLLVARVLGYIMSSRHGLSEAELKDVLSLDDEVLQTVYQDWTPPSKELLRFPPLLWVRLRRDLGNCLARRPVDGFTLLAIAYRQLAEVVIERYLSGPEKAKCHGVLADFFSGAWSQGTKKLITLPLMEKPLNLDRKVAPQPLWFSDTVANLRKLKELPYHLLHSGRIEELKQEVLGISGGIEGLLDDFDLCAPHMDCPEVGLVREALQLCRPAVELRGMGITAMAWSLEEKLLVVGTQEGIVAVWDMEEQQVIHMLTGHTGEVRCVKVFAKGMLAISASKDHTLRLWNLLSGQEKFTIWDGGSKDPTEPQVWSLHVDEAKKVVYLASSSKVSAWNLETAALIFRILGDASDPWMFTAALTSQAMLLTVSRGDVVSLWSSATGKLQKNQHLSSVKEETLTCGVSVQKQGKMVIGFSKGSISLVSSEGDSLLEKLPEAVEFLVVSEDESLLAAGFGRSVRIFLADSQGFHRFMATDLEHEDTVETAVFGPENNLIVTGSRDALIQANLLFTGLVSGIVLVFPLNSRQDVMCIPPPEARKAINCMALSKDEGHLAIAYDSMVLVLDISPGDPCPVIDGPTYTFYTQLPDTIASVAVLADYRVIYGMTNGDLFLYECVNSKVFPLEAHGSQVTCVEVSHKEQLAVSGSEEALLCLWDLQACKWKFEMSYTNSYCRGVQCASFSKDDKYVYAGLKDRSIIVWSVLDGALLAVQFVHAVVNRIIPTSNGLIAPSRHGYLIRERFQCPSSRISQQDPLKNFKKAVEDALTYLDQVKIRFGSDPATYNGFLEIMKEFKSQSIDTPGVIRRVSQLFHEHPDLIVGFNAFLPLGYRIDIPKNGKLNIQSPLSNQENSHNHSDCAENFKQQMLYKEDKPQVPLESDSVEFNNAISYVNKIKTRFLDHPEIYRSFLEILHTYQKEQLSTKGRPFRGMSEEEVFTEVANLFRGQEDLLSEFGQFLPEAKRSLKKMKLRGTKDLSIAAVGKYGTLQEFSFFDKVRRVLKSQEVYENFLRCIALFNQELVSGSELLQLVSPFLGKFPELFAQFKSFLGVKELSFAPPMSDRSGDGISREIDYASCKRIGSSYRALPKTYQQPKCSGRTAICKEVLNDTWVSFPSWSEDSTFVSSKKTPYEEQLHRCEDERFELDVVLETNLATIRVLESVQKKLSRMAPEDQEKFRLDDCLGGTSEVIQRRAIHRIYGDKAPEIIESLKKNPVTAVPVVLKRLKAKEEEWREAQQGFNKIWREQYEKAYLKSLDHQAVNFKQNDTKALRSKSLLNEIESVYDEHQEQHSEGRSAPSSEPHLIFVYEDRQILEDAAALISYYVKRQPAIQKEDQGTIHQLVHQFVPSLFFSQQLDLGASEDSADEGRGSPQGQSTDPGDRKKPAPGPQSSPPEEKGAAGEAPATEQPPPQHKPLDDVYSLFFANNNWYFFLRLHQTLCSRLLKIYRQAQKQLLEYRTEKEREKLLCEGRREKGNDPAMELRLKQPSEVELEEYYPAFLDMVRSLLEGSIDPTQYEDTLREMFTIHAYVGFTMDKLVQSIARQLHHLVSDDVCLKVVELYLNEKKRGAAGGNLSSRCVRAARETSYQWKAERCMADENCFKVMFLQRKGQVIMTIELLDTEEAQTEDPVEVQHLARYVEQYVGTEGASSSPTEGFLLKPVFLQRNLKKFRRWQCEQVRALRGEAKSSWKRLVGVESACNVDCRFKLSSHKMMFIVNSEDYMYRRGTLCRAKQVQPLVLLRHHQHFEEWHSRWLEDNVTVEAAGLVQDWLMGEEDEDMVPCKTLCETVHVHGLPVTRYRVQYSRRPASP
ncbi:Paired amphipathic helix protein Sin3b [Camelus dromedarius]|uniref:Paired amphipathic helix protein Sin3b n=1 Tax=Camelus dromedarius TaxID=9838 RepID=A0A5N4CJM4_CAMDR|nr:Paired amphipathic helix protein Sin3b [Camelus dromedarius]